MLQPMITWRECYVIFGVYPDDDFGHVLWLLAIAQSREAANTYADTFLRERGDTDEVEIWRYSNYW